MDNLNDKKEREILLTAYVLGEMSPEEALAFEKAAAADEELQEEVRAISEMAEFLSSALENEPFPPEEEVPENGLFSRVKDDLTDSPTPEMNLSGKKNRVRWSWKLARISLVLIICAGGFLLFSARGFNRQIANNILSSEGFATKSMVFDAVPAAESPMEGPEVDGNLLEQDLEAELDESNSISLPNSPAVAESTRERAAGRKFSPRASRKEKQRVFCLGPEAVDPSAIMMHPDVKEDFRVPEMRNSYEAVQEQKFHDPKEAPFSTFGVDVDTASFTQTRHFLTEMNRLPPPESVRVEEFINYFKYDLKGPEDKEACPFETTVEVRKHPWRDGLLMAMVSLKGYEIPRENRPKLNLVFLLDVSGSMSYWNRLPLVKDGMLKLLDSLSENDRVSIVTYANGTEICLEPTSGAEKEKIEKKILALEAGGSTAGGEGLQQAYALAKKNFDSEAVNRVILCSDGDFNVGMTDNSQLLSMIEREAKSGVFLTVLGFGMGNFHDDRMKMLAAGGNGNYAYVDSRAEANRVLVNDLTGSMVTIAKDVKLQIEFNPAHIAAYRLIGYEKRRLADRDFHDDRKDSGEIGAGHSVTALYELVPSGVAVPRNDFVDKPRYAPVEEKTAEEPSAEGTSEEVSPEWMFVKLRWKQPEASESTLKTFPVAVDSERLKDVPSVNFQFASGVALFGMLLQESENTGKSDFGTVLELIAPAIGDSEPRKEFRELVERAGEF